MKEKRRESVPFYGCIAAGTYDQLLDSGCSFVQRGVAWFGDLVIGAISGDNLLPVFFGG